MRPLLLLSFLFWTTPGFAQTAAPKANALTPKEIADGWLLLFDGTSNFGWKSDGTLKVSEGKLAVGDDAAGKSAAQAAGRFQDFELRFEYALAGKTPKSTLTLRRTNRANSQVIDLASPSQPGANNWITALVTNEAGRLSVSSTLYRAEARTVSPQQPVSPTGGAQLEWTASDGSLLYLRNVKLRPLALKPIFNGKDLTGWKEFPGKKSKFTITPDGAINIKNGPGDLQTEGKYDDFVLQLECISNGKHLNSGVFFRCRPNEYQNGYEAQIRNQFTSEPTQEYVLEDYDPQSHKLLGKRKEKFTAVDYGTGAIYRRQPARQEVARDGEWFTYTILADKNHLMTWVNGFQVAYWTDNRPRSDNARTGCRLEAGHISLQGHDPTTDLSFRRLRIADLK
jgi:hypothetical protein